MTLIPAQKQKRYRENLVKKGLYELAKAKHAAKMKAFRQKLTGSARIKYLAAHADSQRRYIKKKNSNPNKSSPTIQTVAKATKKVKQILPKDPNKKKLVIQAMAQSVGLLPIPTAPRVSRSLPLAVKNAILHFYERDDISYQMPGKRDTIVVKEQDGTRKTYQKSILLFNVREAHQMFLQDNPGIDVSRSVFAQLRPPYVMVKSSMPHRVCVCLYHQNVNLLIDALSKYVNGSACSDLQSFTTALVCDESNEQCMSSNCNYCSNNFKLNIENKVINENVKLKWFQWEHNRERVEKIEQEGTVKECVQILSQKVKQYLNHVFIKRQQSNFFEQMKADSDEKSIVVQVDYAENFSIQEQDAVQSAHWSTKTISIFTAHAWCGPLNFSFALPSDNITHNKYCVNTCLDYIIGELKQYLPDLKTIKFFSDGAASQFKQRFLFRNLIRLSIDCDLNLSWSFFATSHGKGVVDAIGGTVKRLVWQEILTKQQCKTATSFVLLAKNKTNTIILHEITQAAIDASEQKLQQIFNATRSVRDTQKLHHVTAIREDTIECRSYSQSTSCWTVKF
ncbi:unnamed protein product [Rotaria sordida]|uniref:Uncharacterized protein n=1 Tax=Rotaria sordida TaxID=392033 RepID=A0A815S302_9BILA|nr:unnamed protein product [Rotaria sordida]CAF1486370.1 unnamed protein product [Rotaria sordida]